jgi:hypothetical protein
MFSREALAGMLLAKGQFFCNVQVDEKMRIGYSVKLGVDIRMDSYEFLAGMQRAFQTYGVESKLKKEESATRKRPILKVRGVANIENVSKIIYGHTIKWRNHDDTLESFITILGLVLMKEHRTMKGLELILELKGALNGINESK